MLEHINLGARIDGLARQDIYELPIRAIREMITNAVCHRSYLCPGKVQVALFDDRLEVTSPGMLDKDLTIEKMRAGISKIRNGVIAKIFAYMNMVETWGTGIPKIFEEAKDYGLEEPKLQDLGSDFRINLYRKKMQTDIYGVVDPRTIQVGEGSEAYGMDICSDAVKGGTDSAKSYMGGTKSGTDGIRSGTDGTKSSNGGTKLCTDGTKSGRDDGIILSGVMTDEEKILSAIYEDETITQKQMSFKTGLSLRTIKRKTVELQKKGKIVRVGNSRSGKWQIKVD